MYSFEYSIIPKISNINYSQCKTLKVKVLNYNLLNSVNREYIKKSCSSFYAILFVVNTYHSVYQLTSTH